MLTEKKYSLEDGAIAFPVTNTQRQLGNQRVFLEQYDFTRKTNEAVQSLDRQDPYFRLRRLLIVIDSMNAQFGYPFIAVLKSTLTEVHGQHQVNVEIYNQTSEQFFCLIQFLVIVEEMNEHSAKTAERLAAAQEYDAMFSTHPIKTQEMPTVVFQNTPTSFSTFQPTKTERLEEPSQKINVQQVITEAQKTFFNQMIQIVDERNAYNTVDKNEKNVQKYRHDAYADAYADADAEADVLRNEPRFYPQTTPQSSTGTYDVMELGFIDNEGDSTEHIDDNFDDAIISAS